ncbi:MAG: hypothetical protein QOF71_3017 [Candidatus Eremiobacteraeota bacterium]|jgi:hypothetical protein|nr:hypothetical protein [Candidatus Eremiobacteraeota bacterium]
MLSRARGGAPFAALLAAGLLLGRSAGAQSVPAPSASPSPPAAPNPLSVRGSFRAYDFTRQNASTGIGGAGQVNQQSIELGLGLHADYRFANTPFSLGASYLFAVPTNGCASPVAHLSPPCGKLKAPALNPDDSLPGFEINALYEAYVQYKSPRLSVKLGDQVFNSLWTSSSDTRIKPTSFQGADLVYAVSPVWSVELADMVRFQGRVNSTFEKNTLLTSFPAGTAGVPANTFFPGGNGAPSAGLQYVRLGYAGTHGLVSSLHLYRFDDIANLAWLEARYTNLTQKTKPFLAFHGGYEHNTGAALVGKIYSTPIGVQGGASVTRNIGITLSYEHVPARSDTIRLPAGDACSAKQQLTVMKGTSFPYLLPVNAPQCVANADGTTTIAYGGFASPYTDGYGTDPMWLTSLTQSPIDRHAPVNGPKIQATWTSNDKRLIVYVTQSYLDYGNALRSQLLSEVNADAQFYASRLRPGPYKGLLLRYRYGSRQVTNVTTYGGLPLFRYNRAQMEYDF